MKVLIINILFINFLLCQPIKVLVNNLDSLNTIKSNLTDQKDSVNKLIDQYLKNNQLSVGATKEKLKPLKNRDDSIKIQINKINDQITSIQNKLAKKNLKFDVLVTKKSGIYNKPMVVSKYMVKPIKKMDIISVFGLNKSGWLFKTKYEGQTCYVHKSYVKYDTEDYKKLKIISEARKSINKKEKNKPSTQNSKKRQINTHKKRNKYNKVENKSETSKKPINIKVIKTESYGNKMIEVQAKITNLSGRKINNAIVTCIIKSNSGRTIDFKKHYVIKSSEGGLKSGNSTYFDYILNANPNLVSTVTFQVDNINYK